MKFFIILATLFGIYFLSKINWGEILPVIFVTGFMNVACVFLCGYLLSWIPDLVQIFCNSTVSSRNRAVIITGCDTGFGHELAKRLNKKGFKVYACCLNPLGYGAQILKTECGDSLEVLYLDVTDDGSIQAAKDFVHKDLHESELWALVNNAGVVKGFQIEMSSMEDFEFNMKVNALGPVRVTKAFLPLLKKSKGRVINVCSLAGRLPCPGLCGYNMSKHAAVVFTEVLKIELRDFGIRVISIEPEFFATPLSSREYVSKYIEDSLESADDEIKAAYGESYIKQAKHIYLMVFTSASPKINLVLEDMEAGVCLKYPAAVYKPRRNIFFRVLFYVGERLPIIYIDALLFLFLPFLGLPSPISGVAFYKRLMTI